jgi:hypothetical protein
VQTDPKTNEPVFTPDVVRALENDPEIRKIVLSDPDVKKEVQDRPESEQFKQAIDVLKRKGKKTALKDVIEVGIRRGRIRAAEQVMPAPAPISPVTDK